MKSTSTNKEQTKKKAIIIKVDFKNKQLIHIEEYK